MSNWFIPDQAIASPDDDKFDHDAVAAELVNAIRSEPSALCVGLIGGFGTGKTSIANLAIARLGNDPKLDPIRVSADRHSGVARSRNIVHSVAAELQLSGKVTQQDVRKALRPLESAVSISFPDPTNVSLRRLLRGEYGAMHLPIPALGILLFLVCALLAYLFAEESVSELFSSLSTIGLLTGAGAILWVAMGERIRSLFEGATVQDATPRAEASDDVERVFARLVEIHHDKSKRRRLVIFVDDIDRLDPDDVLEALRVIKSLQAVPRGKEPVFVVSCDERVIIEAIAASDDAPAPAPGEPRRSPGALDGHNAARSFLEKFFNLRVVMPFHVPGDMREYASSLVPPDHPIRVKLQDRFDRVVRIMITDDIEAPRKVVRRLNDFLAAFHLAQLREQKPAGSRRIHEGDVTGSPEFLARLIVLRETFPKFYHQVVADHDLLEAADRFLLGQRLTATQLDVLERHKLIAETTSGSQPDHDARGDGDEPPRRNWNGDGSLRDYLMSTARHLPAAYPARLTALIYLSHSPSGRVLGNARVTRLILAVRRGDKAMVAQEVDDSPPETHSTIAADLATLIQDAAPIDLVNIMAGSVGAIPALSAGSDVVAEACARALRTAPEVVVAPEDVIVLLENSGQLHRDALHQSLTGHVPSEDDEDRDIRMRVAAEYVSRASQAEQVVRAVVEEHLDTLHERAGWEIGQEWLKLAVKFDRSRFSEFLDDHLLPALIGLLRETKTFTLADDGPALVELARLAEPTEPDGVLDDICALTDDDPALLMLAGRLIEAYDFTGTADASELLARLVGESKASLEDRRVGVERLAQWAPVWHDVSVPSAGTEEEDGEPLAALVADSVAVAVQSSEELTEAARHWLGAAVREGDAESVSPVVEAIMQTIAGIISEDEEAALAHMSAILEFLDSLEETDRAIVVDTVLTPLEQRGAVDTPAVRIGLQLMEAIANSDAGRKALSSKADTWRAMLAEVGRNPDICIAAFNRLGEVAPEIWQSLQPPLFQQLGGKRSPASNLSSLHLHILASISWTDDVLADALARLNERWEAVLDADENGVFQLLCKAVALGVDAPEELFGRLEVAVSQDPLGEAGYFANLAWDGFAEGQRVRIAAAAPNNAHIQKLVARMTAEELGATYSEAIRRSSLTEFLAVQGVAADIAAAAAIHALRDSIESGTPLAPDDTRKLVSLLGDEQRRDLGQDLIASLPADNPRALASVRTLNWLELDTERRVISDRVAQLLPEADDGLAYELGRWEGKAKLPNSISDILKDLRKQGRERTANQFEAGRHNS